MKLTLHLGFHKTASTHLQTALAKTVKGADNLRFVGPKEFRANTYWFSQRKLGINQQHSKPYLDELTCTANHVVISDGNICGHSDDIFRHTALYEDLTSRLCSLTAFTTQFERTEVWVVIRNPATFLPSIYSEAMRWKPFLDFDHVFSSNYKQSWLPVISSIQAALPKSKINVFCYEDYPTGGRALIESLGLDSRIFQTMQANIIRRSASRRSMLLHKQLSVVLPKTIQKRLLQLIESVDGQEYKKFAPFTELEIQELDSLYAQDIERIKQASGINFIRGAV
jgi:hypothetical protein